MAKISIIIPAYNAGAYIGRALDSIVSQSFVDFEIIVVDDGSTDNTRDVVSTYSDSDCRVIYYWQEGSGGPASPRNKGLQFATCDYIAIFDADDIMLPGKLEKQYAFFAKNPDVALIFSNYEEIDEDDHVIAHDCLYRSEEFQKIIRNKTKDNGYRFYSTEIVDHLLKHNFIPTSSVIVKKEIIRAVGGFDENLKNSDDHDMWLKILQRNDCACIDVVLHQYRVRDGNISSRNIERLLDGRSSVLERYVDLARSENTKYLIRRKIASYQYTAGYCHFSRNELDNAKAFFWKSLKFHKKLRTLLYFIVCFSGEGFVTSVRRLKRILCM